MSAKRSFDVQPRKEAPARRTKRRAKETPAPRRRKTLREKRREARGTKNTFVLVLFVLCALALLYGFWRPEVRITSITAEETPDPAGIAALATETLTGTYYHLLPRNSFFMYSEKEMRRSILDAYPSISALSIQRTGFTELSITASSRQAAFVWCGTPEVAGAHSGLCYETDAEGFVFSPAAYENELEEASLLHVFASLDIASSTRAYPLGAKVEGAAKLPDILRFARAIGSLGIVLRSVAIRGDEADLYSAGDTRITYVVGKESEAAHIADSTFGKLNFMDGSIEYVDLRFGGKAYIKRRE